MGMSITTRNEEKTRPTPVDPTTASISSRIFRRLSWVIALTLTAVAITTAVTAVIDSTIWWQSATSSGLVAFVCMMAAIYVAYTILADPASVMKVWIVGMYVHFAAVVGIGLTLKLGFDFHPLTAILGGALPAMICVFGNAWIVQSLNVKSLQNTTPDSSISKASDSLDAGDINGHFAETQS